MSVGLARHGACSSPFAQGEESVIESLRQRLASRLPVPRTVVPRSFAARLGLANSLLIALVCATLSWVLAGRYLDHVGTQLAERGRAISEQLAREAGRSVMEDLPDLAQQARTQGAVAYVRFFDAQGLLLASGGGGTPVGAVVPLPPTEGEVRGPIRVGHEVWEFQAAIVASGPAFQRVRRSAAASALAPQRYLGTVVVGMSLDSLEGLRERTFGTAALFTTLFTLIAAMGAVRLARAITRPVAELATAAEAVAQGDFTVAVPVRSQDEIGRFAGTFNAMVDSLRRSASLEEKVRELQEVTRLKSEFLAAVSHELRTPLNVIIGYAEMLTAGAGGVVTREQAEMLDAVRRYSRLQLELINNVLDYSRLVSGKVSFHVERFTLAPLCEEIMGMHRARLGDRQILLDVVVDPETPSLMTDRIKLHEIVRNLVDNAVKFTESGSIGLTACPGVSPDRVVIEVSDTGPGIPPAALEAVFEAFQQVGPHTARYNGGVGLGLSIVKQLVDALGGQVSVESRVGDGSTFRVEIPRILPAAGGTEDEARPTSDPLDEVTRNVARVRDAAATLEPSRHAAPPRSAE